MFERFTERARRVVVLAQEEARMLDHDYIGTEHILLGLIHEGQGVAAEALKAMNVSIDVVRERVAEIVGRGEASVPGAIPFTPRAKKVLEASLRESRALGDESIGTEHILLGLLDEPDGVAVQIVRSLDVHPASLRAEVLGIVGQGTRVERAVRLRPMTPEGYEAYVGPAIDHFASELEQSGAPPPNARERAEGTFGSLLPQGLATPGHVLAIAEDAGDGARVGLLWFGPSEGNPARAWLYDIEVNEDRRGTGWGRAIMRAFEAEAKARGFTSTGLNVFGDNDIARHLYESLGYAEVSRQMYKDL